MVYSNASNSAVGQGWTGFANPEELALDHKRRPWCRGKQDGLGSALWFPLTTVKHGQTAHAVALPVDAYPAEERQERWILVTKYARRPDSFKPRGRHLGTLNHRLMAEVYKKLQLYWPRRGA